MYSKAFEDGTIERMIPEDLEVDLAVEDAEGRETTQRVNARDAFNVLKDDLTKLENVLKCIKA